MGSWAPSQIPQSLCAMHAATQLRTVLETVYTLLGLLLSFHTRVASRTKKHACVAASYAKCQSSTCLALSEQSLHQAKGSAICSPSLPKADPVRIVCQAVCKCPSCKSHKKKNAQVRQRRHRLYTLQARSESPSGRSRPVIMHNCTATFSDKLSE